MTLENLLENGEDVAVFGCANSYFEYKCIIPSDKDIKYLDISACLEDTLHRLVDAGASDEEISAILNAEKEEIIDKDFNPEDEWISLDLGYYIPSGILFINKQNNAA